MIKTKKIGENKYMSIVRGKKKHRSTSHYYKIDF